MHAWPSPSLHTGPTEVFGFIWISCAATTSEPWQRIEMTVKTSDSFFSMQDNIEYWFSIPENELDVGLWVFCPQAACPTTYKFHVLENDLGCSFSHILGQVGHELKQGFHIEIEVRRKRFRVTRKRAE